MYAPQHDFEHKKTVVSDSHDSTDSEVVALWRTFAGRKKYREE